MLPYEKRLLNRETLVKTEAESNVDFGKVPSDRSIEELLEYGIININKPKGPTSHEVSEFVKEIIKGKRAGQSGTLDPAVTGVLPIGLNKGTKVLQSLLNAGKEYVCLMHIHKPQTEERIKEVCAEFVGKIKQLPPIKSAVKRQWRWRTVYYIDVLEIKGQDVLFKVGCEAGTYIRKLCSDMGDVFGCGAHMAQLVRTKVGVFDSNNQVTIQKFKDLLYVYQNNPDLKKKAEIELKKFLFPMEKAIEHIPKIWVFDSVIPYLVNGSDLMMPGVSKFSSDIELDELVAVLSLKGELVLLGRAKMNSEQISKYDKGLVVRIERVLMPQGVYLKDGKSSN